MTLVSLGESCAAVSLGGEAPSVREVGTKAHIPLESRFALAPNTNEIYTKKMKCTWPTQTICVWDPTQPIFH